MTADTVGGVWTYALELARGLAERGATVLIAALGGRMNPDQARAAAAVPGVEVRDSDYPLEWMDAPWEGLRAAGAWLQALADEFRPDLVHLNHYAHAELNWGAPVLRVTHSCVYSWHHAVRREPPDPARWLPYRRLVREGLRRADAVVAPTRAMLLAAARCYGPFRRARVIHNGRRAADFPVRRKRACVLGAGRLWDEAKNVRALIEVAPELRWPVMLAGEARHPDGGEAALAGVRALGRLGPDAMARAYGRAAIFAHPACYEPFGLSVLEAALAGCALVLGDIASLRELWEDAALFVPPRDRAVLKDTLRRLAEDDELRVAYAERARDRAAAYSVERMVNTYRDLYQQLMEEARTGRRFAQGG